MSSMNACRKSDVVQYKHFCEKCLRLNYIQEIYHPGARFHLFALAWQVELIENGEGGTDLLTSLTPVTYLRFLLHWHWFANMPYIRRGVHTRNK